MTLRGSFKILVAVIALAHALGAADAWALSLGQKAILFAHKPAVATPTPTPTGTHGGSGQFNFATAQGTSLAFFFP